MQKRKESLVYFRYEKLSYGIRTRGLHCAFLPQALLQELMVSLPEDPLQYLLDLVSRKAVDGEQLPAVLIAPNVLVRYLCVLCVCNVFLTCNVLCAPVALLGQRVTCVHVLRMLIE